MQVDAWERGFSYSYDAPLDMRMDTRQEFSAADLLNEWPESRIAQVLRRFGEERYAGGIAREIIRRRPLQHHLRAGRRGQGRGCRPRLASAPATRPSGPSRRSGSPSTGSSTRSRRRCRSPGGCCRSAAASPRSPSTRSRIVRSSSSSPPALSGCICPPELPVCVCGHEPEAELLTRRAVAPGPEEVAEQPALALGPPARRGQDRRGGLMGAATLMAVAAPAAAPARAPRRHRPRKATGRVPRKSPPPQSRPRARSGPSAAARSAARAPGAAPAARPSAAS